MPRGGPRRNSGGRRPGAGRPPSPVLDYRREMQARLQEIVSPADVDAIVKKAVEQAAQGDHNARAWLAPYILGKPPEDVRLHHSGAVATGQAVDLSKLTDTELAQLERLVGKVGDAADA
ncbi:MAG: hypothetical protein ACR2NO_02525 [Chloroflexota bacterium]